MKIIYSILFFLLCSISFAEDEWFSSTVVDANLPAAYQVAVVDINNDAKPDIAALGEGKDAGVFWYENPSWRRRPIADVTAANCIDLAFHDIDADGKVEMALAYGFNLNDSNNGGNVCIMKRQADINLPWQAVYLSNYPTAHRLRWTTFRKENKAELWVLPLMGIGAKSPEYNQFPTPFMIFQFTDRPINEGFGVISESSMNMSPPTDSASMPKPILPGRWSFYLHPTDLHMAHGIFVDQPENRVLAASDEGITAFWFEDAVLKKRLLCKGNPAGKDRPGCSEIVKGKLFDRQFLATIEPWHGNQLAVYDLDDSVEKTDQSRLVLEDTYSNGHALAAADFDRDGEDEILAGYRGKGIRFFFTNM